MSNQVAAVQEMVMMGLELNLIMLKQLTEVSKETKSRYLMPLTSTSSDNEIVRDVRPRHEKQQKYIQEDVVGNKNQHYTVCTCVTTCASGPVSVLALRSNER